MTAKNRVALNEGQRPEPALATLSPRHEITYRATTLDVQPLAPDRADLLLNRSRLLVFAVAPSRVVYGVITDLEQHRQ